MPTVEWNRAQFGNYPWPDDGEEWSAPWGGSRIQWFGAILPRIQGFVPTGTILEIACGYGRWTRFLKDLCDRLVAVDLSEACIDVCQRRFADSLHLSFQVNDGSSLDGVPDASIDLAFSFDSLVHVGPTVMEAYLAQLPRILKPDGVAFLHHSNLGEYPIYERLKRRPRISRLLRWLRILESTHLRDGDVTAGMVEAFAKRHGLTCISQELTPWLERRTLIDCISVVVPAGSPRARSNRIFRNYGFPDEVRSLARLSGLYS